MKIQTLFSSLLLTTVLLAGCGTEPGCDPNTPPEDLTGKAFLSLSLLSNTSPMPRTNTTNGGTEGESGVTMITALLFNEMNVCLDAVKVEGGAIGNGSTPATASDAITVPAATKKIFVIVNPNQYTWNPDSDSESVKGQTWTQINTVLDNALVANVTMEGNFLMTSVGDPVTGPLIAVTPVKPTGTDQAAINAAKAAAENAAVSIFVDRLAAKVTVSTKDGGVTVPDGVTFTVQGWDLNVTNRSVKLYSDLVTYDNATTGAVKGVYRKDKNYLASEQPDGADAMKAAFNYLTNGGADATDMSTIATPTGTSLYCLENTMDAPAQQLGFTTKAVVKAKYAPKDFAADASYFFWNGEYFTLDAIKAAYLTHADGTGLKVDLPEFLIKAKVINFDQTPTQAEIDAAVAALQDNSFTATTGIVGRYCAVRYYHQGVCYYDVLIRHDQNVTTNMALGRYGVVRNNWYALQINSVSHPGTPWIPDPTDPDDPTKPKTDNDQSNAYLSVKISINPWTFWSQGVDLN